jgi:hypothetical protein
VILRSYEDLCKRQIKNDFNFASCVQVLLVFEPHVQGIFVRLCSDSVKLFDRYESKIHRGLFKKAKELPLDLVIEAFNIPEYTSLIEAATAECLPLIEIIYPANAELRDHCQSTLELCVSSNEFTPLVGKLAELCADSLASDLLLHLCKAGIAWFGARHHESELGGFYCWLAGRVQDIDLDLDAIKVDYDALFRSFEDADCSAGPFLDLLVLLCASDNFKGRLLAELDKQLQLCNPYHLTSYSHMYCLFFRLVSEREKLDQFIRERVLEGSLNDLPPAFFESLAETFERFQEAEWSFAIVRKAIHEMVSCEILRPLVAKFVQMSENTVHAELVRIIARQLSAALGDWRCNTGTPTAYLSEIMRPGDDELKRLFVSELSREEFKKLVYLHPGPFRAIFTELSGEEEVQEEEED